MVQRCARITLDLPAGMCQRITRQSNAAKIERRRGRRDAVGVVRDSEILKEDVGEREERNYHHHREQLEKQLASQLRIKVINLAF